MGWTSREDDNKVIDERTLVFSNSHHHGSTKIEHHHHDVSLLNGAQTALALMEILSREPLALPPSDEGMLSAVGRP